MPPLFSRIFEFRIHFLDDLQDLIPAHLFNGTGDKVLGKKLPGFPHFRQECLDIEADSALIFLVGLGEDQTERNLPFSQVLNKFQVKLLGRMPAVDQDKDRNQILPFAQVVLDHLLPFLPFPQRHFCKAIPRKVDNIPLTVDDKMVQKLGLTGRIGSLGQFFITGQHVDERGFTHIATANEGIFGFIGLRAAGIIRAADDIGG